MPKLDPFSEKTSKLSRDTCRDYYGASSDVSVVEAIRASQQSAHRTIRELDVRFPASKPSIVGPKAAKAGKLRGQLTSVLRAPELDEYQGNRNAGRLDRHAIARIGAGAVEGIYAKRVQSEGYDTEVAVLVDTSSSMRYSIHAAAVLGLVIAQACQQTGVKCEIVSFGKPQTGMLTTLRSVKARDEKADLRKFDSLYGNCNLQCTPLTGSMVKLAARLARHGVGKRKIMFVITDGVDDHGDMGVRKANDYARRLGVETVGLHIDCAPNPGFDMAVMCGSDTITQAGLGALVSKLTRNAA